MTAPDSEPRQRPTDDGHGLDHLGEDTTGFGRLELRTARSVLLHPAAMLEAYMTRGPTGGGQYSRPLRFYLALCGLLMLQLFVMGGTGLWLSGVPADILDPLIAQSGKSRDAFIGDADNWISLVLVPINAVFYALFAAPLLRWWDTEDLGWRKSFRATFHYLNVWTIPMVPVGFFAYLPSTALWFTAFTVVLSFVAFLRVGRGRWYRTTVGGVGKAVVITVVYFVAATLATIPVIATGLAGAVFG